jgi:hypothetical protein
MAISNLDDFIWPDNMKTKRKVFFGGDQMIICETHYYIEKESAIYYARTREEVKALAKSDRTPLVSSGSCFVRKQGEDKNEVQT